MSLKQVVALVDSDGAYITLANPLKVDVLLGAAALPVNIGASIDRRIAGMIAGLNEYVEIDTAAVGSLGVQVSGTWVATLAFEGTVDGSIWNPIAADPGSVTSTTANGSWTIACAGQAKVRVRASAFTSGSASVTLNGSTATSTVVLGEPLPSGDNPIGRVKVTDGTDVLLIDGSGRAAVQDPPNLDVAASTLATQATLASVLGQLDAKTSVLATAAKQDAAQTSLSSILGQLDSKTSTLATQTTIALVATTQTDGNQKTQVTSSALPTGAAKDSTLTDGSQRIGGTVAVTGAVSPANSVDATNSSTTPLGGAGTFTGTSREVLSYSAVEVFAYSDVAGTLYLEFSTNGSNWDLSIPYPLTAGSTLDVPSGPHAQYFRVRYVNGGAAQSAFRLQTLLLATTPAPHAIPLGSVPTAGDDAVLTQSEIVGLSSAGGGTYVPVKVSPSGAVQVGGAVDIGQTNAVQVLNTVPTSGYGLVVRGVYPSQGSTTSGQTGPLTMGAVTTAAPSYTNAQTSPFSLTLAGALRTDASATTQPISNANLDVALSTLSLKNQFPTTLGQTTKTGSLSVALASDTVGTAGSASSTVLTIQGVTSMTPVQVSQATASNLLAQVFGGAANGANVNGNPVRVAGSDGTSTRDLKTDTSGNLTVIGGGTAGSPSGGILTVQGTTSMTALVVGGTVSSGSAVSGNPVIVGGSDGTNAQRLAVDTSGRVKLAASSFFWKGDTGTATIKSGAGIIRRIVIGTVGVASTVLFYDNTSGSGQIISNVLGSQSGSYELNAVFSTGLTVVVSTAACGLTVVYD